MPDTSSSTGTQAQVLATNRAGWDQVAPAFYAGTALPEYGPLAPTEETLHLLDPVSGARVLELGCGSGHSLAYLAERGAAELWGVDLSPVQIAYATEVLRRYAGEVRLFEAPMEVDPGLPADYFDLVLSIYGLGWTTDLLGTLTIVTRVLKPGGCLLFSWEHPHYSQLRYSEPYYVLAEPYHAEGPVALPAWRGVPIVQHRRTLSTFVNTVLRAGLQLERLEEGEFNPGMAKAVHSDPTRWYAAERARLSPTTLIVKARKPKA
jgi:SAM-dependent methyltransferase